MAKVKRYEKGGVTEGQNLGIDDDTRARAMKYVQEQSEKGSEDEGSGEKVLSRATKSRVSTRPTSNAPTRSDPDAPIPTPAPAETPRMRTKKEMYRTLDGKMVEKAPKTDTFKGMRESIGGGLKSAGESIGSYLKSLGNREEKHGTYIKDGKVVRYAKGGMTKKYAKGGSVSNASSRADGIAQRGKTRCKIC